MPTQSDPTHEPPLASFVLRVTGRPAVLRFELQNIRSGEVHRFTRVDALADFLRQHGVAVDQLSEMRRGPPG
jgi:hypothetical protein